MYQVLQYIKFLFSSTNQHGVHSPFVYDLVTKCFYDNTQYKDYKALKAYKKSLLTSKATIEVTDLGAGSKVLKTNTRAVSSIAKTAVSYQKRMRLMYRLFKYFKPNNALELGTSLGAATYAMTLGNSESKITTIEGCPNISSFTASLLSDKQTNINFVNGHFKDNIPTLTQETYDIIFFDGHHNKAATLDYFETLLPKVHNDTLFIFDDIYWSKGMTEAWEMIKQHPRVTVTIDTFFWGFVFFRKEQAKEHFKIRV